MTIFSFHPVKHITTGEGGAVLTNNHDYYEKLIMFRSHGITKNIFCEPKTWGLVL
jgi:dTDP-4-amino-4,6-dideoxygalactose transaminase